MKNKTMDKIEKLELEYDDWKRGLSLGSREIHIIIGVVLKVNEIIDILNSRLFEPIITVHNQSQKQPEEKCIHYFPLSSEGVCQKCGIKFEDIKPEKQKEWEDKLHYLLNGYSSSKTYKESKEQWMEIRDYIEQLLSERTFSKEELRLLNAYLSLALPEYNNFDKETKMHEDMDKLHKILEKISKLLKKKE